MKHFAKFLLLLLTGALLFTACGGSPGDTSSDDASDGSNPSGGLRKTLVSVGKPYKASTEANATYPDVYGQQLTDGQKAPDIAAEYRDVRMVGYTTTTRFDIDLGDDGKRLTGFSVRSLDFDRDGVRLARGASFYGSTDGEEWVRLGIKTFTSNGVQTVGSCSLDLDEPVDYRYVRVMVTMGVGGGFFFLDEIEVYADVPEPEKTDTVALAYQNESVDRTAWQALSTGKTVGSEPSENVALLAPCSLDGCETDERAPFADTTLVDGEPTGRLFGESVWVGFRPKEGETATLTLDLGKTRDDLFAFRLHALGAGLNVVYPDAVDVYASEDGENYTLLGRMYAPPAGDNYAYTLLLPEYIRARYIRYAFTGEPDGYWWVEEAEVLAGTGETESEFYPAVSFPTVTEELRWDSSEPDYRTSQNLLLGLPQQMAASFYEDTATAHTKGQSGETPADSPVLTDGDVTDDLYCYSDGWFFHRGGGALNIFYDLGKLSTVENLRVYLLEQSEWGISRPSHMTAFLSEDAVHWYPVAHYDREANVTYNPGATQMEFDLTPASPVAARFVRFRIESAMLFLNELEAIGTKEVADGATRLADLGVDPVLYYAADETESYATTENTPVKAKDIAIVYGEKGDENTLLPFVAYLDEQGNIVDTFMDGFLYCPTGALPSGVGAHETTKKVDWDFLFDNTFNGVTGLDKLDEVVGQVKSALNKPDYKVYVYCTILYPHPDVTDFGDVDGDGVSESMATAEGRAKIFDWYLNRCIDEFASRGYENIELNGFYWVSECVIWERDDADLIKEVSEYVHAVDMPFLWVPYYTANRYFLGYELGFDMVCMQPNYVFQLDRPLYRLPVTADRTKAMGMCVEIEHTFYALSDSRYARQYMQYLHYGVLTGYDEAIHVYYDDVNNYAALAYSDSPLCRMQYDATYHFTKQDLDITPDDREELRLSASADSVTRGTLVPDGDGTPALYTLVGSTAHGSITLTLDGQFAYFPDKGYTGEDSFTYTYNHYLGESSPCTVTFTVG